MSKITRKELTEKIFGVVHEINLENVDKGEPKYTLADMLGAKNITALRKLGKLHQVSAFSKMDKDTIVTLLIEKMAETDRLWHILFVTEELEWNLFKKAAKTAFVDDNKLFSDNYRFLRALGYLGMYYYDGSFRYVVPIEIQTVYKKLEADGFPAEKEHGDLLNSYAIAITNLYGVITQDDFVALFNSQNKRKTNLDEMFSTLLQYITLGYGYCFWDDYIVNDDFEDNDFKDVSYYAKVAAPKPRYLPDKQTLLEFADWDYIEQTPQLVKLRSYINNNLAYDEDLTEDILEEIYFLGKNEAEMQSYLDVFEEKDISLTFEQIQAISSLTMELRNNTRLWLNNGHTPNELFTTERKHLHPLPQEPSKSLKVGRNEPCPCGSGKKYKRCCGK